jgi:predicted metal-binding membrane protein
MPETAEAAWRRRTRIPVLLATAAAWVAVVELSAWDGPAMQSREQMAQMAQMGHAGRGAVPTVALMVAAMMTPLLIPAARHVAARTLRRRRPRAISLLVVAHAAVWLVGGVALQVVGGQAFALLGPLAAPTAGIAVVLVWHMSPTAQRCGNRHHAQPPLAAFGTAADLDVLTYGARHAAYCLGACWPLMLLPALCGAHQLAVMALCSVWVWVQAQESPTRPRWRLWLPARPARLVRDHVAVRLARAG